MPRKKGKITITAAPPKHRNIVAVAAMHRKSAIFKHKNEPKGGAKQEDYLGEWGEEVDEYNWWGPPHRAKYKGREGIARKGPMSGEYTFFPIPEDTKGEHYHIGIDSEQFKELELGEEVYEGKQLNTSLT